MAARRVREVCALRVISRACVAKSRCVTVGGLYAPMRRGAGRFNRGV